ARDARGRPADPRLAPVHGRRRVRGADAEPRGGRRALGARGLRAALRRSRDRSGRDAASAIIRTVLSDELDVFLLDLDGVVYVGDRPVPHAAESIARLRAAGRVVRFVTNDPRPTREDLAARLGSMGIEAAVDEIASSG